MEKGRHGFQVSTPAGDPFAAGLNFSHATAHERRHVYTAVGSDFPHVHDGQRINEGDTKYLRHR